MKKNKKNNFIKMLEVLGIIAINMFSYYILYMHELGLVKTILIFTSLKISVTLLKK